MSDSAAVRLVVNPAAGHGAGRRQLAELRAAGKELGLDLAVWMTEYPGHAMELAAKAVEEGARRVVVMGGDGTVGEVAGRLVQSGSALGIVAVGTGNDVARSLGLPLNNPRRALEIICSGKVTEIDVGVSGSRHFLSVFGAGFPVEVAAAANKIRKLKGSSVFILAICNSLRRMKPFRSQIKLDNQVLEGSFTSLLVQNTPYTGGGLLIAPMAQLDDGSLDVITVGQIGKAELLMNLPRLYRGKHLGHPKFKLAKCETVEIKTEESIPTMFDGDVFGSTPVRIEVKRKALKVIVERGVEE